MNSSATSSSSFATSHNKANTESNPSIEELRLTCIKALQAIVYYGKTAELEIETLKNGLPDVFLWRYTCTKSALFVQCVLKALEAHKQTITVAVAKVESEFASESVKPEVEEAVKHSEDEKSARQKKNIMSLKKIDTTEIQDLNGEVDVFGEILTACKIDENINLDEEKDQFFKSLGITKIKTEKEDCTLVDDDADKNEDQLQDSVPPECPEGNAVAMEHDSQIITEAGHDTGNPGLADDSRTNLTTSKVIPEAGDSANNGTACEGKANACPDGNDMQSTSGKLSEFEQRMMAKELEKLKALGCGSSDSDLDLKAGSDSEFSSDTDDIDKEDEISPLFDKEKKEQKLQSLMESHSGELEVLMKSSDEELEVLMKSDDEVLPNDLLQETVNYQEKYNLKECSISLTDVGDLNVSFGKSLPTKLTTYDKELRQIENLTNLETLKRSHRASTDSDEGKRRKKKIRRKKRGTKEHGSSNAEIDMELSTSSCESDSSLKRFNGEHDKFDPLPGINADHLLKEITNFEFKEDDSDMDVSTSDDETDIEKETKSKQAKKKDTGKKEVKEIDSDLEKRKKWKQDRLLTERFSISSSSSDREDEEEDEEKMRKKLERLDEKRPKKHRRSSSPAVDTTWDIVDSFSDSSDYSSDVEFVKTTKRKKVDSEDEFNEDGKKSGRKNIRAVKSYESLEEATKKAAQEEEERLQRLHMKQKNLSLALSQASTEILIKGLVLDVDDSNEPLIVVNEELTNRLKNHQQEGVRFMWNTCYESVSQLQSDSGSGCILAHCMGLGKTFQVVTLIHTLLNHPITNTKHVLVVCPLSTVLNWDNEFKIGLDHLTDTVKINRYHIGVSSKDKKLRSFIINQWRKNTGVLIMGYEAYQAFFKNIDRNMKNQQMLTEALVDPGPDLVICDEGHLLKNGKNNRTQCLMKLKTRRRIILTGTPLQNNLIEYYYMVQFVKPNLLGTLQEYSNRFVNPITNGQYDDSTANDIHIMRKRSHVLHKLLKQTVQRYEVSELKTYLPQILDYVLFIPLHPVQIELYKTYLERVTTTVGQKGQNLFSDFHNLRNVWSHPYLLHLREKNKSHLERKTKLEVDTINLEPAVPESEIVPLDWWKSICPDDFETNMDYGPKFKVMLGIIEECQKVNDKVLIFSSSLAELDTIEYILKKFGTSGCPTWFPKTDYLRMDGTVPPDIRMEYCNKFNDPKNKKIKLFLISHRVGGLGLNLVAANRIILMDVNFNPAYDAQSIFRIYRFGQTKHCYVYRLVSMGTMEEVVYERSVAKLAIAGRVVDEMQISRHYKSSELQKMYRFNVYTDKLRPVPKRPVDDILAATLQTFDKEIFTYHEHQSLLENKPEEELNEAEMQLAWDEFRKEKENHNKIIQETQKLGPPPSQFENARKAYISCTVPAIKSQYFNGATGIPVVLSQIPNTSEKESTQVSNIIVSKNQKDRPGKTYHLVPPLRNVRPNSYSWPKNGVVVVNNKLCIQNVKESSDASAGTNNSIQVSSDIDVSIPDDVIDVDNDTINHTNITNKVPNVSPRGRVKHTFKGHNVILKEDSPKKHCQIIDLEQEEFLQQINKNNDLTLSTITTSCDINQKQSTDGVIEID